MTNPEELLIRARSAAERAHCPYSNFRVGAAVRCTDGTVVEGCNVENASYGLSICAERVALFSAVARGLKPVELALSCIDAPTTGPETLRMPCGACRQVMHELLTTESTIHVDNVGSSRLDELLPRGFCLKDQRHDLEASIDDITSD